ncbi:hypothetical protein AGMMS49938_16480 [Fibrobacterales bacterium]|nr:hypothetical protein AGMMS49938_16480 [Fibrobacterales bacterium]
MRKIIITFYCILICLLYSSCGYLFCSDSSPQSDEGNLKHKLSFGTYYRNSENIIPYKEILVLDGDSSLSFIKIAFPDSSADTIEIMKGNFSVAKDSCIKKWYQFDLNSNMHLIKNVTKDSLGVVKIDSVLNKTKYDYIFSSYEPTVILDVNDADGCFSLAYKYYDDWYCGGFYLVRQRTFCKDENFYDCGKNCSTSLINGDLQ